MEMRFRIGAIVITLLVLLAGAGIPALSQADFKLKPGARGKLCLDCHVTFEETMSLPSVHTPARDGNCADCHNPHATTHGKLLASEASDICITCHTDVVPEGALSVHEPVLTGRCIDCHDPHAAPHANNLKVGGNELCNGCHTEIATAAAQARVKHDPVEKNCLGCHDPHASTRSAALLRKEGAALCTDCHTTDRPFFARQHVDYPVAESNCTSCHNPHGSDNRGIMWASIHRPITAKMCKQCHEDASSPDALNLRKEGLELCRGCHADVVNETLSRNRVHWPAVDKVACLNCHSPHASPQAQLLKRPTRPLCATCHEDTHKQLEESQVKHPPAVEGDCSTCHAPHASNNLFLLQEDDVLALCGTCHDYQQHSRHPIGDQVADPRNANLSLDCRSCHRGHGSPFKSFAHFDTGAELCVACHLDQKR
jgi:predicted CXXCH cytochrome family protein